MKLVETQLIPETDLDRNILKGLFNAPSVMTFTGPGAKGYHGALRIAEDNPFQPAECVASDAERRHGAPDHRMTDDGALGAHIELHSDKLDMMDVLCCYGSITAHLTTGRWGERLFIRFCPAPDQDFEVLDGCFVGPTAAQVYIERVTATVTI